MRFWEIGVVCSLIFNSVKNSDFCVSLWQIEKEEVVLRRIIGAKKDQYFLDNKLVTYVYEYSIVERVYFTQIFITQ